MNATLVLLGGSLVAVLGLAGAAWLLRLGGGSIADTAEASRAAEDAVSGFRAVRAVVASDGRAALAHGADGSVVLLKLHGTQIAARHLRPPLDATITPEGLRIATGDRWFGTVTLRGVGDAG